MLIKNFSGLAPLLIAVAVLVLGGCASKNMKSMDDSMHKEDMKGSMDKPMMKSTEEGMSDKMDTTDQSMDDSM